MLLHVYHYVEWGGALVQSHALDCDRMALLHLWYVLTFSRNARRTGWKMKTNCIRKSFQLLLLLLLLLLSPLSCGMDASIYAIFFLGILLLSFVLEVSPNFLAFLFFVFFLSGEFCPVLLSTIASCVIPHAFFFLCSCVLLARLLRVLAVAASSIDDYFRTFSFPAYRSMICCCCCFFLVPRCCVCLIY